MDGKTGWAPPTYLEKKKEGGIAIRVESVDRDLEISADSEGYIKVQPSGEFQLQVLTIEYNDNCTIVDRNGRS